MARETTRPIAEWQAKERQLLAKRQTKAPVHSCDEHVEYVETDGPLGQAYYCGLCGALLQVG